MKFQLLFNRINHINIYSQVPVRIRFEICFESDYFHIEKDVNVVTVLDDESNGITFGS